MKLTETDTPQPEYETQLRNVPLDSLTAGLTNVRSSPGDVSDLAQSIKTKGLEHPILIRPAPNNPGMFEVIAGSRRVAAVRELGMKRIHARVVNADDVQALTMSLDENEKRGNLSAREMGEVIQRLRRLSPIDPGDEKAVLKWVAAQLGWFIEPIDRKGKVRKYPDITRVKKALEDASFQEAVPGIEIKVRSRGDFRKPTVPLSVARQVMPIVTEPRVRNALGQLAPEVATRTREEFLRTYAATDLKRRRDLKDTFLTSIGSDQFIERLQADPGVAIKTIATQVEEERSLQATVAFKSPYELLERIEQHLKTSGQPGWTRSDAVKDLIDRGLKSVGL